MSEINTIKIRNTFHCPDCSLIYSEDDTITIRTINRVTIHDCDNCLSAIELDVNNNTATLK